MVMIIAVPKIPVKPSDPGETALVGAAELVELEGHLRRLLAMSDRHKTNFDPVTRLRCTGDVIRAAECVIATAQPGDPKRGVS